MSGDRLEELRRSMKSAPKGEKRNLWKFKKNWGMWVLLIGFALYLITWYVVRPMITGG